MSLKSLIETEILKSFSKDISENISLEVPRYEHGDFTTNISFKLAKELKKNPNDLAKKFSDEITNHNNNMNAEAIGGFINIKINDSFLINYFESFLSQKIKSESNDKILLEYVSANPTGPLHIGHGRWAVIGDCINRLLKTVGESVDTEFYINDAGNQVAIFNESIEAHKTGAKLNKDSYGGYFIDYIAKNNSTSDHVLFTINYQKEVLKKLNCSFDKWFRESTLHKTTDIKTTILNEYSEYIYEKDGALWFKTTEFNDDKDRVIIKENGDLTYFAADIVYHLDKIKRGYTELINIWGADHHGYIERIRSCIKAKDQAVKLTVILGQLVKLFKDGKQIKMSKRTGDLIELDEVIDEIGIDATRYFLVEKKAEQPLDFDLTAAKEKSMDNPVYYIQYAHARICTIEKKTSGLPLNNVKHSLTNHDRKLILLGSRYYDTLLDASKTYEPYKIAQYLVELARQFHSFYQESPIIIDNKVNKTRLQIIITIKQIIQHASNILGISTPEKM